jgi:hypothetical protein
MWRFLFVIGITIPWATSPDTAFAAVVFTDFAGTFRPTSITGITVSGTTYDFEITYNVDPNTIPAGLVPAADSSALATALIAELDSAATAQNIDSNTTGIRILAPTHDSVGNVEINANVFDNAAGIADWDANVINGNVQPLVVPSIGYAAPALAGSSTVPEPSTLACCGTIALGVLIRRRRRRNVLAHLHLDCSQ